MSSISKAYLKELVYLQFSIEKAKNPKLLFNKTELKRCLQIVLEDFKNKGQNV